MLAISRFEGMGDEFEAQARAVVDFWRTRQGCISAEVVRNLDDEGLWAIVTRWESVGDYRRSFGGYDAKMILTPVLSRAVDEPSAYLDPAELGPNLPRMS